MYLSNYDINKRIIIVLMAITVFIVLAIIFYPSEKLPIINPEDLSEDLLGMEVAQNREEHRIGNFKLINQNGDTITNKDYHNKIFVANFIFTRCLSICPIMTTNMAVLQEEFSKHKDVQLLSISVTPVIDSVPVLKEYALKNNVNSEKWNITTGNKKEIYDLARNQFYAVLDKGDGGLQDFIHTSHFILVDKKSRIRGIYDGTDLQEVNRLIEDIKILRRESFFL